MNAASVAPHAVPWPTPVPQRPGFVYSSAPDAHGQWWIHVGCQRCGDVATRPCQNPQRTGYWVVTYVGTHECR